ncbi:hypothetical protein SLEP1_g28806 [Rubroshorea leprosula]|uniref:Uncharacterized protein n=1 Tax=Rubroshorea leprosula TaxID=152421 RepID=A0AAV5K0Z2_9ROSI|nr:hypothetical protein SLEP1_g28806 [Rubroshorea leprosula]
MIGMKMEISLFSGIEHDWNEIVFIALSRACLFGN